VQLAQVNIDIHWISIVSVIHWMSSSSVSMFSEYRVSPIFSEWHSLKWIWSVSILIHYLDIHSLSSLIFSCEVKIDWSEYRESRYSLTIELFWCGNIGLTFRYSWISDTRATNWISSTRRAPKFLDTGFPPHVKLLVDFVQLSRTKPHICISTRKPILNEPGSILVDVLKTHFFQTSF